MEDPVLLRVDGLVETPLDLRFEDLDSLPENSKVLDVSRFHPKRKGDGVTLESILERARPKPEATYLTLHAERDDFHVSVPLEAVRGEAIVVYRLGADHLGPENGGPIRFLIRDPSACHAAELDDCANVKSLSGIELTASKGRDTRPADEVAHEELHAAQAGGANS